MGWRDELAELHERREEAVRRRARPASPEHRRREAATTTPIFVGVMAGMLMAMRAPSGGVDELALWLVGATALTVLLARVGKWPASARAGAAIATPACALGVLAVLAAANEFLMSLG